MTVLSRTRRSPRVPPAGRWLPPRPHFRGFPFSLRASSSGGCSSRAPPGWRPQPVTWFTYYSRSDPSWVAHPPLTQRGRHLARGPGLWGHRKVTAPLPRHKDSQP
jgi:hypothetical protein